MENNVNENVQTETQIKEKKSFLPVIIAIAVVIIAGVVYFSFFSEAAVRDREIKAHIASAEKYLDDLDYEKAIAEYETILKLDPSREDVLDDFTETALAWSEDVADDDLEKAMEILEDAIKFLEKNASEKGENDEYIEKLQNKLDKYNSDLENSDSDEAEADDDSDNSDVEEDADIANYTSEIIDVDGIVGDSWWWKVTSESIVCVDYRIFEYSADGEKEITEEAVKEDEEYLYKPTICIYDYNGNLIKEIKIDKDENRHYYYDSAIGGTTEEIISEESVTDFNVIVFNHYHGRTGIVVCTSTQGPSTAHLYDYLGNVNSEIITYDIPYLNWHYQTPLNVRATVDEQYLAIVAPDYCYDASLNDDPYLDILPKGKITPIAYIDCESETIEQVYAYDENYNLVKVEETSEHAIITNPEYDEEQFLYCSELEDVNSEAKYLIETNDEQWGYADEDFNILALYEDASGFNIYGYALVSDDREQYDLIDSEFNVIEENFVQGNSASTDNSHTMLVVVNGDDRTFYLVKGEND